MSEGTAPADLRTRVERVLTSEVLPLLQMDGGSIDLLSIDQGVVRVRLRGACGSCPSSIMAIIMSIEEQLRKHIPEVEHLEAVP